MLSIDAISDEAEQLWRDLEWENYRASSGQKSSQSYESLLASHQRLIDPATIAFVVDTFRSSEADTVEHRRHRILMDILTTFAELHAAAPVIQRATSLESRSTLRVEGRSDVPYHGATIAIANERDPVARRRLDDARGELAGRLAPMLRERLELNRKVIVGLGLAGDYVSSWEILNGTPLGELRVGAARFLEATSELWEGTRSTLVRERLGIAPADATRADALALFRGWQSDPLFPKGDLQARVFDAIRSMGIDPLAQGRIIPDVEDRPGKSSRGFCIRRRVPEEVYFVMRPQGGWKDWMLFLHELGHALHYAYTDARLPFEFRYLGDMSVSETYAALLEGLLSDALWLRSIGMSASSSEEFARFFAINELYALRRWCGKFEFELELYGDVSGWTGMPSRYSEVMRAATGFQHRPEDAFVDTDPWLYVAFYLRAHLLRATLVEDLAERFGATWWSNARAGQWIIDELLSRGSSETADEVSQRVRCGPLSFQSLQRSLQERLV